MKLAAFIALLLAFPAYAVEVPACQNGADLSKAGWGMANYMAYDSSNGKPTMQHDGSYIYRMNDKNDFWLTRQLKGEKTSGDALLINNEIVLLRGIKSDDVQIFYLAGVPRMLALAMGKAFPNGPGSVKEKKELAYSSEDNGATRKFTGYAKPASPCAVAFSIDYAAAEKGKKPKLMQHYEGVWAVTGELNPIDGKINIHGMERWFARALADPSNKKYTEMSKQIPDYVDISEARTHAGLVSTFGLDDEEKINPPE